MRFPAIMPDELVADLETWAKHRGFSRAAALRVAAADWIAKEAAYHKVAEDLGIPRADVTVAQLRQGLRPGGGPPATETPARVEAVAAAVPLLKCAVELRDELRGQLIPDEQRQEMLRAQSLLPAFGERELAQDDYLRTVVERLAAALGGGS